MTSSMEWLSTKDASEYIGVTLRTLYKLIDEGFIPAYKIGRVIRVKKEDVDSYLQSTKIKPGELDHLYPDTKRSVDQFSSQV